MQLGHDLDEFDKLLADQPALAALEELEVDISELWAKKVGPTPAAREQKARELFAALAGCGNQASGVRTGQCREAFFLLFSPLHSNWSNRWILVAHCHS